MTQEQVKQRLTLAFPQSLVEVTDLTGTEDHYQVLVESQSFAGLSRIQQHQKVMSALDAELKSGEVHALSIRTGVKQ